MRRGFWFGASISDRAEAAGVRVGRGTDGVLAPRPEALHRAALRLALHGLERIDVQLVQVQRQLVHRDLQGFGWVRARMLPIAPGTSQTPPVTRSSTTVGRTAADAM